MVAIMLVASILLFASFAVVPAANPPSAATPRRDAPDFAALRQRWAEDLHDKRLEESVALYAPDATFLQPDGAHAEGIAAIRTLYQTVFATYDSDIQLQSRTVERSKDLAFDSGSYTETLRNRSSGSSAQLAGDYLTVYRRTPNGAWLIVQQSWSMIPPKP